jgi:hypothetical protein
MWRDGMSAIGCGARTTPANGFGPTTPTRARQPFDASVDPTEARKGTGSGV